MPAAAEVATVVVEGLVENEEVKEKMDEAKASSAYIPRIEQSPSETRLIILQITDIYTLEHLAYFKTLVDRVRTECHNAKVICVCTGDFLAPYILSTFDNGISMMNALNYIPVDYIMWGNHENDVPNHNEVVAPYIKNFKGKWLNSNIINHIANEYQYEYDIIHCNSIDGTNIRNIGLCAVLSNDSALYRGSSTNADGDCIGPFGGATITDPWIALQKYYHILKDENNKCDLVIPFEHLYVSEDYKSCELFDKHNMDIPIVLSGHDHHKVDEIKYNTRIIKPGLDGIYTSIIEIVWNSSSSECKPTITSQFVKTNTYLPPHPILYEMNIRAYDILEPLRNTELSTIPNNLYPLSSCNARGTLCSMGTYICTLIKTSFNIQYEHHNRNRLRNNSNNNNEQPKKEESDQYPYIDVVLLCGGNLRGNQLYDNIHYLTLEALESEIRSDDTIHIISNIPGYIIKESIEYTHTTGQPYPGYMQYDIDIKEELLYNDITKTTTSNVTHINNAMIDMNHNYTIITKLSDIMGGGVQCPPLTKYLKTHPHLIPSMNAFHNIHRILLTNYAQTIWHKIWNTLYNDIKMELQNNSNDNNGDNNNNNINDRLICDMIFHKIDYDNSNIITLKEIQYAILHIIGYKIHENELTLAKYIHSYADINNNGLLTKDDFYLFVNNQYNM